MTRQRERVPDGIRGCQALAMTPSVWVTDRGRVRYTREGRVDGRPVRDHDFLAPDQAIALGRDLIAAGKAAAGAR